MSDRTADSGVPQKTALGLIAALLAVGSVWLGFQLGHLGQRVRRAYELVRDLRTSAVATNLDLISESLLDVSHSIFAVRLWLFIVGVCGLVVLGVFDWAAVRVRAAAAGDPRPGR